MQDKKDKNKYKWIVMPLMFSLAILVPFFIIEERRKKEIIKLLKQGIIV